MLIGTYAMAVDIKILLWCDRIVTMISVIVLAWFLGVWLSLLFSKIQYRGLIARFGILPLGRLKRLWGLGKYMMTTLINLVLYPFAFALSTCQYTCKHGCWYIIRGPKQAIMAMMDNDSLGRLFGLHRWLMSLLATEGIQAVELITSFKTDPDKDWFDSDILSGYSQSKRH